MEAQEVKQWDESMGEISGFGGGYEQACRNMVLSGIAWLDEHPTATPEFAGFKNVYGVVTEENDDAKALTAAILAGSGGDATGAMHHASVQHCLAYKRLGWDEYCRQLRERKD